MRKEVMDKRQYLQKICWEKWIATHKKEREQTSPLMVVFYFTFFYFYFLKFLPEFNFLIFIFY